jgi:hypothetical protein
LFGLLFGLKTEAIRSSETSMNSTERRSITLQKHLCVYVRVSCSYLTHQLTPPPHHRLNKKIYQTREGLLGVRYHS